MLPPSPCRGATPPSTPPGVRRSASLSSQLVSQCVRGAGPGSCELTTPGTPTYSATTTQHESEASRLPGTFHCLHQVQDTGVTPSPRASPRALTPLVLLPLQESAREKLQSSLKRKLKTSLGVRLGGSYSSSTLCWYYSMQYQCSYSSVGIVVLVL